MKSSFRIIIVIIGIGGCSKTPSPIQPPLSESYQADFDSISITNSEILDFTYSAFRYPTGFYQENLDGGSPYYENTLSILPLNQRSPHWSELSTNSRDQALAWSESTAVNSSYYRTRLSESQTDKYFQFRRVYQQNPNDIVLSRVHKLTYLDRSMFDSFNPTSVIAKLNARPIDSISVRTLVEYLWFIRSYNTGGAKALASITRESIDSVWCALYNLAVVYGDFGVRDQITLHRSVFSVSKQTGEVVQSQSTVRVVQGRQN